MSLIQQNTQRFFEAIRRRDLYKTDREGLFPIDVAIQTCPCGSSAPAARRRSIEEKKRLEPRQGSEPQKRSRQILPTILQDSLEEIVQAIHRPENRLTTAGFSCDIYKGGNYLLKVLKKASHERYGQNQDAVYTTIHKSFPGIFPWAFR
ncbi:hypothetical protein EBZ80_01145 [bacterium]|nr:hypothetical protein [bacterium]